MGCPLLSVKNKGDIRQRKRGQDLYPSKKALVFDSGKGPVPFFVAKPPAS
jgi:hypothetical protein